MKTDNLLNLKIHRLTNAQYDREKEAGNLDPTALYLTPDDSFEVDPKTFYITAGQKLGTTLGQYATAEGMEVEASGGRLCRTCRYGPGRGLERAGLRRLGLFLRASYG